MTGQRLPGKQRKPWFVYTEAAGRFSAMPASLAGWLALLGIVTATGLAFMVVAPMLMAWHPLAFGAALFAVIIAMVLGLRQLAIAKGQRMP